jgi:hypothetical protein
MQLQGKFFGRSDFSNVKKTFAIAEVKREIKVQLNAGKCNRSAVYGFL